MVGREHGTPEDEALWSRFDAEGYWKANFSSLFPEDEEIIRFASAFLNRACAARTPVAEAIDVGSGTNLYPALLMLPWAERIVLTEYATANIDWLAENLADEDGEWSWQPFWDLMADLPAYRAVGQPRHRLAACHEIRQLSVFELPARSWSLGSMFFVADGMTDDDAEFEAAVRSFLRALTAGAPFLMAFMAGSDGYEVSGVPFPAVRVSLESVRELLGRLPVTGTDLLRTDRTVRPLRHGYDAMVLVTGYVAADRLR